MNQPKPYPARSPFSRRTFAKNAALCGAAVAVGVPAHAALFHHDKHAAGPLAHRDLSRLMVDSVLKRFPTAPAFGKWAYYNSLFLMGAFEVYKRTHEPSYLAYIKSWVDTYVDSAGKLDHAIGSLDDMQPGNLLVLLYAETGDQRYATAAKSIRTRIDTYSRTTDGGFWHAESQAYKQHELWLDGTFMILPFMMRYSRLFGDQATTGDEVAKQLLIDYKHNAAPNGLLYHAYDESGKAVWAADNPGHHSHIFWGRAMGWYAMTLVDALDYLPANHPQRGAIIDVIQRLAPALAKFQDPATGLWFQIVDQPQLAGNWNETSCTCMYLYMLDVAVKRGYIDRKYHDVAARAYAGVLTELSLTPDGLLDIHNVTEGTDVGETDYYLNRKRKVNDPHGLGAFLIMNEEWVYGSPAFAYPPSKVA